MLIANTQGLLHFSAMAGFAGEHLGQVIGAMPAGSSCLQVWGDGHSVVLLTGPLWWLCVEQHWGHFQTPSPNFQCVTPLSRVHVHLSMVYGGQRTNQTSNKSKLNYFPLLL